jgi:ABC-type Mn2+/Zn2+ transport system ATPase subunit
VHHPILELRDVSFTYGEEAVLRNVDLVVREGAFLGIVGPSGAGKTTLLGLMEGSLRPTTGSIDRGAGGEEVRLGVVPQLETIDWNFPITVEEVVLLGLAADHRWVPWSSARMRSRAAEILEQLGIGDLAHRHIRNLSGGQQQRTFIARAMMRRPNLLLLDEPTSGVDVKTRHDVLHLLHDLNHRGIAIVLTTHDLNAVAAHLPSLICFNKSVVATGTPEEVLRPEVLHALYGADMLVVHEAGLLLVGDVPSASLDDHPRESHPPGTRPAHFGEEPEPHEHGVGAAHDHAPETQELDRS